MPVIHEPRRPEHECALPSPASYRIGTLAECDRCGRRWRLRRHGVTFKDWQRTIPTLVADVFRGPAYHGWAKVQGD